jgi:threonine/homoserine efflux transporter RhtA
MEMLALSLGLLAALSWGTHDLLVRRIAPGAQVLPQLAVVMTVAALVVSPLGISRASAVPMSISARASPCIPPLPARQSGWWPQ